VIIKVITNEFIKLFSEKKFYVFLLVIGAMALLSAYAYSDMKLEVLNNTAKAQNYSDALKAVLLNMTPSSFLKLFATDFIYKPFIPLFLIFVGIIGVNTFCEDYVSGNMKFFLVSPLTKVQLFIGKMLYMLLLIVLLVLGNMVFGYVVGNGFFGMESMNMTKALEVISIYLFAVLPAFAFTMIIALLSLVVKNTRTIMTGSIILAIGLTVADSFSASKYFSPVGAISVMQDGLKDVMSTLMLTNLTALGYSVIGIALVLWMSKKIDIAL